ncbi:hypothetical protein [Acinetobacter lwoffii]|uniref:Uncharacterized protein n=1 Tax=Acinetobacter lwoffii NIPH 478 TaxID=1217668 RepID=N9HFQ7_ACILW|nr:hypothetical protein [Acinetobacter lwoffii]ENW30675.1 hypothetical protein F923_01245 [Acinetobacter lwoffii NIPH 478]
MDIEKLKAEFEQSECFKRLEHVAQYTFFEFGAYIKRTDVPADIEKKCGKLITALLFSWSAWKEVKAQAVPGGFILIKDDTKTVVAIERMVEQQVEASGMDSRRLERLDGWKIIEAAVKAQEPQITELKVEWASDCFKCGHHEAIIYSTAAEASTKGWFHDGDEVKCTGCGNTGEMDARGEDSDICWNEDEAND